MKMLNANWLETPRLTKFTLGTKRTRTRGLAGIVAALAICGHALAQTPLEIYDSAIAADALLAPPLDPGRHSDHSGGFDGHERVSLRLWGHLGGRDDGVHLERQPGCQR